MPRTSNVGSKKITFTDEAVRSREIIGHVFTLDSVTISHRYLLLGIYEIPHVRPCEFFLSGEQVF